MSCFHPAAERSQFNLCPLLSGAPHSTRPPLTRPLPGSDYNQSLEEDRAAAKLAEGPYEGSKVLQVRRGQFGKMGRTKYTHLGDQDTTSFDSPWAANDKIRAKFAGKQGGLAPGYVPPVTKPGPVGRKPGVAASSQGGQKR